MRTAPQQITVFRFPRKSCHCWVRHVVSREIGLCLTYAAKFPVQLAYYTSRNLVPSQFNIWMGHSRVGSSTGLHHDFHDNFYCLVRGELNNTSHHPPHVAGLAPEGYHVGTATAACIDHVGIAAAAVTKRVSCDAQDGRNSGSIALVFVSSCARKAWPSH